MHCPNVPIFALIAFAVVIRAGAAAADGWDHDDGYGWHGHHHERYEEKWAGDHYKYKYRGRGCKYEYKASPHGFKEEVKCKGRPHAKGARPHARWSARGYPSYDDLRPHRGASLPYDRAPIDLGLGRCNRDAVGALIGAAVGGLTGSQIGRGSGQLAAVGAGVFLGGLIGHSIGPYMDDVDYGCVGHVLESAPTHRQVVWDSPETGARYTMTPTHTYQVEDGRYCREYQTEVFVAGRVQEAYGTACRQPDGAWQIVN